MDFALSRVIHVYEFLFRSLVENFPVDAILAVFIQADQIIHFDSLQDEVVGVFANTLDFNCKF